MVERIFPNIVTPLIATLKALYPTVFALICASALLKAALCVSAEAALLTVFVANCLVRWLAFVKCWFKAICGSIPFRTSAA